MSMTSSQKSIKISLFGQTTKQPSSNFDARKSLKNKHFGWLGPGCLL